jgi:hypothetical protein
MTRLFSAQFDADVESTSATPAILVHNAVEEALNGQRTQLQNIFSQKGFVVDKRVNKNDMKDMIFRVSLGKNDGLKQGTKLEVYT